MVETVTEWPGTRSLDECGRGEGSITINSRARRQLTGNRQGYYQGQISLSTDYYSMTITFSLFKIYDLFFNIFIINL